MVAATQAFPLRLTADEHEALKTFARLTGRSANDVLRAALRDYLADSGRREEFDELVERAREQYAVALDKLADL